MTRILYGLCSVGIGHAVRSKVVIKELLKKHDLRIVASGFAHDYLKKYFKNKVINIEGFELAFHNNQIANIDTIIANMKKVNLKTYFAFLKVIRTLKKFNPQFVISDWETFSSFYAFSNSLPLISIGNTHYLAYGRYKKRIGDANDYIKSRFFLRTLMFPANYYLINCLPGMQLKRRKNVIAIPPLLREEIINAKPKIKDYIFVYQSTSSYSKLVEILKNINERFVIYGFGVNKKIGNLVFKKFDDSNRFIKDMAECKAVISNGGFTLISEAVYLKKPLLVIPIKHHYEQILNARYIKKSGLGEAASDLTESVVRRFLIKKYRTIKIKHENNKYLFKLLEVLLKK